MIGLGLSITQIAVRGLRDAFRDNLEAEDGFNLTAEDGGLLLLE